jgi:hypothetical protein
MMFRDMMRCVSGACCAAVMMCSCEDASGMLEDMREGEAEKVKARTQLTTNPGTVHGRTFETEEKLEEYLDAIKNSENPEERIILEVYNKLDVCLGKAGMLYGKTLTDEDLDSALEGLAFYKKEFVPSGMDFGVYPYGHACALPLFRLFSIHWEHVIKKLTENRINEENLGFVMLLVPAVMDYEDSHGFGTSKLRAIGTLENWCANMRGDVKALAKIENRLVISLIVHCFEDTTEMLHMQYEIQRLKDQCSEMMF